MFHGQVKALKSERDIFKDAFLFHFEIIVFSRSFEAKDLAIRHLAARLLDPLGMEVRFGPFTPEALSDDELGDVQRKCATELAKRMTDD